MVGVLMGLAFVGTEIRQNTLASRAQSRLEGVYSQVSEGLIGEEALDYYGVAQPRFDEPGFWLIWAGARHSVSPGFRDFFEQRHDYSP